GLSHPWTAEDVIPQGCNGVAMRRLRAGIDSSLACALKTDLMLKPSIFPIRVCGVIRDVDRNEHQACTELQQRDIARVAGERALAVAVRQHEVLNRKLDVDHPA